MWMTSNVLVWRTLNYVAPSFVWHWVALYSIPAYLRWVEPRLTKRPPPE